MVLELLLYLSVLNRATNSLNLIAEDMLAAKEQSDPAEESFLIGRPENTVVFLSLLILEKSIRTFILLKEMQIMCLS